MNILVTGATGFIGSRLCRALVEENHEVFALSHSRENERIASLLERDCFHLVNGDVCSLPTMQEVMERNKIDTVIHEAAYISNGHQEAVHTNVKGTLTVLQAASSAKCPRIIYASSRDVYGVPEYIPIDESHPTRPLTLYGLTKLHGENYCEFYARHHELHVVVLRYAGVYGHGKRNGAIYNFIRAALESQPFQISSDGNQTRDFVYIGDVVNATMETLNIIDKVTFDVYNIGSGRETSLNELAVKVIEASGVDIDYRYTPAVSDDRFVLDIAKARRVLNYRPCPIEDALAEFIQLIKSGG